MSSKKFAKIFCIGLSRTGTTSICNALCDLGIETLHFSLELFIHPETINENLNFSPKLRSNWYRLWRLNKEIKALNIKYDPNLLDRYDAFGDLPIPLFFKELDRKFPGSKFIYSYRNEEKWLKSMKWLFEEGAAIWKHGLLDEELLYTVYGCKKYNENLLKEKFRTYHKEVNEYFSGREIEFMSISIDDKSLDMNILSNFLGLPNTKEKSFPKKNHARKAPKGAHLNYWLSKNIPFYGLILAKLR